MTLFTWYLRKALRQSSQLSTGDTLQNKKNMKRTARFRNLFVFAKVMGCMKRWRQIAARRVNYTNKFNEVHSKKKRNKSYTVDTIQLTHNEVKSVSKWTLYLDKSGRLLISFNFHELFISEPVIKRGVFKILEKL